MMDKSKIEASVIDDASITETLVRPSDPAHYGAAVEGNAQTATAAVMAWGKSGFLGGLYGKLVDNRFPAANLPSHHIMRYGYNCLIEGSSEPDKAEFSARMAYVDILVSRIFELENKALSVRRLSSLAGLGLQFVLATAWLTAIFLTLKYGGEPMGIAVTLIFPAIYWLSSKHFARKAGLAAEGLKSTDDPSRFFPWMQSETQTPR